MKLRWRDDSLAQGIDIVWLSSRTCGNGVCDVARCFTAVSPLRVVYVVRAKVALGGLGRSLDTVGPLGACRFHRRGVPLVLPATVVLLRTR